MPLPFLFPRPFGRTFVLKIAGQVRLLGLFLIDLPADTAHAFDRSPRSGLGSRSFFEDMIDFNYLASQVKVYADGGLRSKLCLPNLCLELDVVVDQYAKK